MHSKQSTNHIDTPSASQSSWRFLPFLLIELLLAPFSVIGGILFLGKLKFADRSKGVSGTAYEPFYGTWSRSRRFQPHDLLLSDIHVPGAIAARPCSAKGFYGFVVARRV